MIIDLINLYLIKIIMEKIVVLSKFHQSYDCNCQLCYQEFNTDDRRPYIICTNQHISCMKCLDEYFHKNSKEQKHFCHFCRLQIFKDKLLEFKPMLSLLEKIKIQKQQNDRLVNRFNSSNKWKKNEVNEIMETMTTKFIDNIRESDQNILVNVQTMKEQIIQKTSHYQDQSQTFYDEMKNWMKNIQIKNQLMLQQTKRIAQINKKLRDENKQILKRNQQMAKKQNEQNRKIDKILNEIKLEIHQIASSNQKYYQKINKSIIQNNFNQIKQQNSTKTIVQKKIPNNIQNAKQKIKDQINKDQVNQNHLRIRSYTTGNLHLQNSQAQEQNPIDESRDFKKQKKHNNPILQKAKQKNNPQININSKKIAKQVGIIYNKTDLTKKIYPQIIDKSKNQTLQKQAYVKSQRSHQQQPNIKKNDTQKQKNHMQDINKFEMWKKPLKLDFLNNKDQSPTINLKKSTMLPTSAKNSINQYNPDEDSSFRRSFGPADYHSVRNYPYDNNKDSKRYFLSNPQQQKKNKFIQNMVEIYGKANIFQYQRFYQKLSSLNTNQQLIILWSERMQGEFKKKLNKLGK